MLTAQSSLPLQREKVNRMPWDEVMHKFKQGRLHSGSDEGPVVHNPRQAIAIQMSERQEAAKGKKEYRSKKKKSIGERMVGS